MSETEKVGWIEEYIKRGGMANAAKQQLENEIQHAITQKDHPLHEVVEATRNNNHDKARRLLITALINALNDKTSSLQMAALVFVKLPAIRLEISKAVDYTKSGNDEALNDIPLRVIQWAAMEIQEDETKRRQLIPILKNREKATEARKNNTKKSYEEFRRFAGEIRAEKKMGAIKQEYNDSVIAQMIIDRKSLPQKYHRTIRRALAGTDLK